MNPKERVSAVLNHQQPDRMPCFGANSTVTYDQMGKVQAFWPQGHKRAEPMAKQALAAYTVLGFDAVRVPFSQTFEAEALGCKIKSGRGVDNTEGIPGIDHPPLYTLDATPSLPDDFLARGRIPELLKAVSILKDTLADEVPVVAGIVGPFTLAGYLLDTVPMLRATVKAPDKIRPFLDIAERAGTALALALIDAGADIISCEDMGTSPDLISPKNYRDLELAYQQRQFRAIPVPKILHICGNVDLIVEWMGETGADILSLEPKASLRAAREKCGPNVILMGGVDVTHTLAFEDADAVKQESERSIADGIQILGPGCAVAPITPMENLMAMVEVAGVH